MDFEWRELLEVGWFSDYRRGEVSWLRLRGLTLTFDAAPERPIRLEATDLSTIAASAIGFPEGRYLAYARRSQGKGELIGTHFTSSGLGEEIFIVASRNWTTSVVERVIQSRRVDLSATGTNVAVEFDFGEVAKGDGETSHRPQPPEKAPQIRVGPWAQPEATPAAPPGTKPEPSPAASPWPQLTFEPVDFDPIAYPIYGGDSSDAPDIAPLQDKRFANVELGPQGLAVAIDTRTYLRHGSEALFAFRVIPCVDPLANGGVFQVRATMVGPACEPDLQVSRSVFRFVRLPAPSAIAGGKTKVAYADRAPIPISPKGEIKNLPSGRTEIVEAWIATTVVYALAVDLEEIDFEIERLFRGQGRAPDGRITARLELIGQQLVTSLEATLSLKAPTVAALLAVLPGALYAFTLAEGDNGGYQFHYPAGASPEAKFEVTLRNLAGTQARIKKEGGLSHVLPAQSVTATTLRVCEELPGDPAEMLLGFEARWRDRSAAGGWRAATPFCLLFKAIESTEQVIGIDVGTTAISVAAERDGTAFVVSAKLGETIAEHFGELMRERQRNGEMEAFLRRESQFKYLMAASCAMTRAAPPHRSNPKPLAAVAGLDARFETSLECYDDRIPAGAQARLHRTGALLDIHLPVLARGSSQAPADEDAGFVICPSIKTQVCRSVLLALPAASGASVLFDDRTLTDVTGKSPPARSGYRKVADIEAEYVLSAVLDTLIYAYLARLGVLSGRQRTIVMTYPASIGSPAAERYRRALKYLFNRDDWREGAENFLFTRAYWLDEASAAAWELMRYPDRLWPRPPGAAASARRLLIVDIGAGTTDIAAFEFDPVGGQAVRQTINVSLPVAGNLLDEALARDFLATRPYPGREDPKPGGRAWFDLMDRVEKGKRCARDGVLPIPEPLDFRGDDERPMRGDQASVLHPSGEGWLNPCDLTDADWPGSAFALAAGPRLAPADAPPVQWKMLDMRNLSRMTNLRDYVTIMRDVVIASALKAAGGARPEAGEGVAVVWCGRACLFEQLRKALDEGVAQTLALRAGARASFLASEIVEPWDDLIAPAEVLKGVAARGAVRWGRWKLENRQPGSGLAPVWKAASFALLRGCWREADDGAGQFEQVRSLDDLGSPETSADGDLFLVLRPPGMTLDLVKPWLANKSSFARRLAMRLLRPMVVFDPSGKTCEPRPLAPYELAASAGEIRLKRHGEPARVSARVEGEDVVLRLDRRGEAPLEWRLSAAFADGH